MCVVWGKGQGRGVCDWGERRGTVGLGRGAATRRTRGRRERERATDEATPRDEGITVGTSVLLSRPSVRCSVVKKKSKPYHQSDWSTWKIVNANDAGIDSASAV